MCKGRLYAEKECLSLVAAILACYDFEAVDPKGYKIPALKKGTGIAPPVRDIRVRVSRRLLTSDTSPT